MDATTREELKQHYASRRDAILKLWKLYQNDTEAYDDEYGNLNEYGLSFDYIPSETFKHQNEGYFTWLLSWGGPSEEIDVHVNDRMKPYKMSFIYKNWGTYGEKAIRKGSKFWQAVESFLFDDPDMTRELMERKIKELED